MYILPYLQFHQEIRLPPADHAAAKNLVDVGRTEGDPGSAMAGAEDHPGDAVDVDDAQIIIVLGNHRCGLNVLLVQKMHELGQG